MMTEKSVDLRTYRFVETHRATRKVSSVYMRWSLPKREEGGA